MAIGVRSSCEASATRLRCASTELLERVERRVERVRQARELVASLRFEALAERVRAGGDLLGAAGEACDRRERRARDEDPQQRGERDARAAITISSSSWLDSAWSTSCSGSATEQRAARADPGDQHADVGALGVHVGERTGRVPLRRERPHPRRRRDPVALAARHVDVPFAVDQVDCPPHRRTPGPRGRSMPNPSVRGSGRRRGPGAAAPAAATALGPGRPAPPAAGQDLLREAAQRLVDLAAQLERVPA